MRYVGGKSRLAKSLSTKILECTDARSRYIEPFIGGGSVFAHIAPHFESAIAMDLNKDVALMWCDLFLNGWKPPHNVSEAEYLELKTAHSSAVRGFVGTGGSFGGKWFGGYARGGYNANKTPRNHQAESARAVEKIQDRILSSDVGVKVVHGDYRTVAPVDGDVIYCDPPYANTQGYSTGDFDSKEFWQVMEKWSGLGAQVFVSEYAAPENWTEIWSASHRQSLTLPEQGRALTIEKLFTLGGRND